MDGKRERNESKGEARETSLELRFNWYPDAFDYTNIILDCVLGDAKTFESVIMTSFLCKVWLNNGTFFALVLLAYRYLSNKKLEEAPSTFRRGFLMYIRSLNTLSSLRTALHGLCIDTTFKPDVLLFAVCLIWILNDATQACTGYNIGSFATATPWRMPGFTYRRAKKIITRGGKRRVIYYQQPYLHGMWLPRKFILALTKLSSFATTVRAGTALATMCMLEEAVGPFVAMQVENTVFRAAQHRLFIGSGIVMMYLLRRSVYPGPGTRKILMLPGCEYVCKY
jgi:hypothetical protein